MQSAECDPCNSTSTLFADTDGDNIGDFCDLDNDNDGILDVNEGYDLCMASTTLNGTPIMENGIDSIGTIISNSVLLEGSNTSGPTTVNGSISLTEMSPLGAMAIEFSGTNQMNFRNSNPLGANPGDMAEISYNFDAPIDLTITWGSGQFDEEEDYTLTFDPSITPVIVNPVADIIINQSPGIITYQTDVVVSAAVARTMTITLPGTTYFNINRTDSDGGSDRGGITLSTQVYCETDTDGDGTPDHLDLDSVSYTHLTLPTKA